MNEVERTINLELLATLECGTTLEYPHRMYVEVQAEVDRLWHEKQFLTVRIMPDFSVHVFKRGRKPKTGEPTCKR